MICQSIGSPAELLDHIEGAELVGRIAAPHLRVAAGWAGVLLLLGQSQRAERVISKELRLTWRR
jgi:hypothetical protein